jgi:hypothetical protein
VLSQKSVLAQIPVVNGIYFPAFFNSRSFWGMIHNTFGTFRKPKLQLSSERGRQGAVVLHKARKRAESPKMT